MIWRTGVKETSGSVRGIAKSCPWGGTSTSIRGELTDWKASTQKGTCGSRWSIRTVDLHLECYLCAKPWDSGLLQSHTAAMPRLWVPLKTPSLFLCLPRLPPSVLSACSSCDAFGGGTEGVEALNCGQFTWGELRKTGRGKGSPWGCFCCHFSAFKETACAAFDSSLPPLSGSFFAFPVVVPRNL